MRIYVSNGLVQPPRVGNQATADQYSEKVLSAKTQEGMNTRWISVGHDFQISRKIYTSIWDEQFGMIVFFGENPGNNTQILWQKTQKVSLRVCFFLFAKTFPKGAVT